MKNTILRLAYGCETVQLSIPTVNLLGVIHTKDLHEQFDEDALISEAMAKPTGTPCLRELVRRGQSVAIVTSDITRPCPSHRMLPYITDELEAAGILDKDVTIIIALGIHRPMTTDEIAITLSPEMQRRFRVLNHNPQDTIHLGFTSQGTPVEFFRPLVEADTRICLGNIEFHYFAGYSGGAKAILPGCASRAAVTANHAMLVRPEAAAGRIDGNPLRSDLEEAASLLGVDFILNVVVDRERHVVGAVAGDVTAAHRAGCEIIARRGIVPIPERADVVVASPGGFPKDINLYQAHKALENAKHAVREGGIIILIAQCPEGFGNQTFESWLLSAAPRKELLERIQREFVLGGHKAAAITALQECVDLYIVSDLPPEKLQPAGLVPFSNPQQALQAAMHQFGEDCKILVLPEATSVLPAL